MYKGKHSALFSPATQRTIVNPSLDTSTVKVDYRTLPEMLSFMGHLSRQFWYYDQNDHRNGDWSDFFQTDITCLFALIGESYNENDYRKTLDFIASIGEVSWIREEERKEDLSETLWELFDLAFKPVFQINGWYKSFTRLHIENQFQQYLKEFIWRKLSFGLRDLYAYYYFSIQSGVLYEKEKVDNLFKRFQELDATWSFNPFPNIHRTKAESVDITKNSKAFLRELQQAVKTLHNQHQSIAKAAKKAFSENLETGKTEPHIALMLGFLKVYQSQQDAINKVVPRQLDFYYRRMLDFENRYAIADQVFILMTLNKKETITAVPQSAYLSAGAGVDGEPVVFETEAALQVTPSVISEYRTLLVNKAADAKQVITSSKITEFDQPKKSKNATSYDSFSMFGSEASIGSVPIPSAVGFAISSPEFYLEGGKRCVEILFYPKSGKDVTESSKRIEKSTSGKITLLDDLVDLQVTGPKGWMVPDSQEVKQIGEHLRIRFGFGKKSAAVSNYNPKTHGKGYEADWPLVVIILKNVADKGGLNPLEVFGKLSFSSYDIRTTTKDLGILTLHTSAGKASPNAVSAPFGGNPSIGSQIILGCYGAFVKHTKLFKVKVNWLNLPVFKEYYAAYNSYLLEHGEKELFERNQFTCDLSWLDQNAGKWKSTASEVELFAGNANMSFTSRCGHPCNSTKESNGNIEISDQAKKPITTVSYNYEIDVVPNYDLTTPLAYTDKSKTGFVALELTGPTEAFGNELYPKVVSQVTLENTITAAKLARKKGKGQTEAKSTGSNPAKLKIAKKGGIWQSLLNALKGLIAAIIKLTKWVGKLIKKIEEELSFQPLPNKPFIPKTKGVTVSYCSKFHVVPGSDAVNKLFKIHPFGVEPMEATDHHFIPKYGRDAYVFLGFEQLEQHSALSLFLSIEDQKQTTISEQFNPPKIEILGDKKWEKAQVIEDGTLGLKKAGILKILVKKTPSNTNTIMPTKTYWMRISTKVDTAKDCKLTMIGTNAVLARRVINAENQGNSVQHLTKQKITQFIQPIPAISKLEQPFPSFGGENPEDDQRFDRRVSQRISNKGRGSSIKNIESIVLGEFQEIYQVNVCSGKGTSSLTASVKVAVLPIVENNGNANPYHPVASASLLDSVMKVLESRVSPQVQLEIQHIQFDKLHVSLVATFTNPELAKVYEEALNDDIKDFLSPWISNNELANTKSTLYVNDLLQFIGTRTYVQSFDQVQIRVGKKPVYGTFYRKQSGEKFEYRPHTITPSSPLHALSSAENHKITSAKAANKSVTHHPENRELVA